MKQKIKLPMILLLLALLLFAGGCGAKHTAFKESARIQEQSASEVLKLLKSEEDFWVFTGDPADQDCIDFQWKLDRFLEKNDKTIFFMNTDLLGDELEAKEEIWKQLGFEEDEEVKAVLHLSNGYRIARYDMDVKEETENFYGTYSADVTRADLHVHRISVDEFFEKLNQGEDMWVYFGRPSCYNCRVRYRKVVKHLDEHEKDLYYVLTDKDVLSEEETEKLEAFDDLTDENTIPRILHAAGGEVVEIYGISEEEAFAQFMEDIMTEPKNTERLVPVELTELTEKTSRGEDFWLLMDDSTGSDFPSLQEGLVKYLTEIDKELLFFDTDVEDTVLPDMMDYLESIGIDEDIPEEMLHLSKGYIVKEYNAGDEKDVKKFKAEFSKSNTRADLHIEEISVERMMELYEAGEDFWMYMGRSSCKDCRKYYPQLVKFLNEAEQDIYYVVSDKELLGEDELAILSDFREQYGIEEVPAVLHMNEKDLVRHYDMQTESDIADFEKDFHDCCSLLN